MKRLGEDVVVIEIHCEVVDVGVRRLQAQRRSLNVEYTVEKPKDEEKAKEQEAAMTELVRQMDSNYFFNMLDLIKKDIFYRLQHILPPVFNNN